MKKIIIPLLIILCLCSCNLPSDYTEPEQRAIVTVMGLENEFEDINIYIQLYNGEVYSQTGNNIEKALENLQNIIEGELLFSQCSAIFIDKALYSNQIKDILEFCIKNNEISLSVKLINCEVRRLFNGEEKRIGETLYNKMNYSWKKNQATKLGSCFEIIDREEYFLLDLEIVENELAISGVCRYEKNRFSGEYPISSIAQN